MRFAARMPGAMPAPGCGSASKALESRWVMTDVSGAIAGDTTWDLARSPFNVVGDVTIGTGATLRSRARRGRAVRHRHRHRGQRHRPVRVADGSAFNRITFGRHRGRAELGRAELHRHRRQPRSGRQPHHLRRLHPRRWRRAKRSNVNDARLSLGQYHLDRHDGHQSWSYCTRRWWSAIRRFPHPMAARSSMADTYATWMRL